MRNVTFIFIILLLSACSATTLDMSKAKSCSQNFLNALKENNFEEAEKYYSIDDYSSDISGTRSEKLEELANSIGKVVSYSVIDSAYVENKEDNTPGIVLTYKVENEKINSKQIFTIQKEDGEYRIVSIDVKAGE